ncbi:unnamed protein product [Hapterophycus canaliculatus]
MDCVPELAVTKRTTVSSAKMARRLRRFVRDNQPPDAPPKAEQGGHSDDDADRSTRPAELLCRIPEETLFQLQQIYEALEDSSRDANCGGGSSGGNRRKSAPGASSLGSLLATSASGGEGRDGKPDGEGVLQTPAKRSKQKRSRGGDDDVKPEPATDSKATTQAADVPSPKKKKKKGRRKSNAT